ncbi:MAG: hypothetical protein VX899_23585 [Myxococcota bacterium]|nr:hypothetical protein [Myxococcota bacterium]
MLDIAQIPSLSTASDQYGVILKGRVQITDPTVAQLRALDAHVQALRAELSLPLVMVMSLAWEGEGHADDKKLYGSAMVGLALKICPVNAAPVEVTPAELEAPEIPAVVWETVGDGESPDGLYVCPAGWSVACLVAGEVVNDEDDDEDEDDDDFDLEDDEWCGDVEGEDVAFGSSENMGMTYGEITAEGLELMEGTKTWFWAHYA